MELEPIENPIVIHPHLLRKFLKHGKNYANLLALYSFYIYHAQLQKTNQPLVTDDFTRKGMNWAIDRVKQTKKILKEMKLIEVVQHRKYYYVHLFFIYTKKKIAEILGNATETEISTPKKATTEVLTPNKEQEKTKTKEQKIEPKINLSSPTQAPLLKKWLEYCDKKRIKYAKNNIKYWEEKLKKRVTIEQQEAVYNAINRGWKDFYITPIKESKNHKFLGKSLMMDKDCDTLIDIGFKDNQFIYQFKNIRVLSLVPPLKLFNRYGYDKQEVKTAPIVSMVRDKILGIVKIF